MASVPGLTDGFKFKPDDEEVIEFYLVPSLRGQPVPLDGVVIDDDPGSTPPWELFFRNGLGKTNEAYFLAPGDDTTKKHKVRACADVGTWVGQKVEKRGELRVGGETYAWKKYRLSFHPGKAKIGSMGWVMLEYSIENRAASLKVYHISFSGHGQKRKRIPDGDGDICCQDPSATHDCHQVYDDAAPLDQEPLSTTAEQLFVDPEMLPMADLGRFSWPGFSSTSTAPAMDHPRQIGPETYQAPLATTTATTYQFVDLHSYGIPGFSSTASTAPAMEHGMMPPEHSVEYRTEPPPMNQDFSMPPEQIFDLESMGDFDFGPTDACLFGDHLATTGEGEGEDFRMPPEQFFDFESAGAGLFGGDHWATTGQDVHHVLTEQSFSTQDQVL